MATKIVMYTSNSCSKCMRAKEMLSNCPVDVNLEERNVDVDKKHFEQLKEVIRSNSLPTFLIKDTHGSIEDNGEMYQELIGFDENIGKIMEHLGL